MSQQETEFEEHPFGYTVKTLCSPCNGRGDREGLVAQYRKFREHVVLQAESAASQGVDILRSRAPVDIEIEQDFMPNRFARHIAGLALACQLDPTVLRDVGTLRALATAEKPEADELTPGPWRIGLCLVNDVLGLSKFPIIELEQRSKRLWVPPSAHFAPSQLIHMILSPFAVVVSNGQNYGTEITHWLSMGHHGRLPKKQQSITLQNIWQVMPDTMRNFGYEDNTT